MAAALTAGLLACAPAARAIAAPSVTIAVLPAGTTVEQLASVPHTSVGVMSAGIGSVPAEQTYLDVSQGNRVPSSLYDSPLAHDWYELVDRAKSVPADIVPGLLASTLVANGVPARAARSLADPSAIATDRGGVVRRGSGGPGLTVSAASVGSLGGMVRRLRDGDLLIAFASPPPREHGTLPIGIAGSGFAGDLTSDSTRTDGYVLSTDIAPTVLRRFGLAVPAQMDGEPVRSGGRIDPAGIEDRVDRMTAISDRRIPLLAGCLAAWLVVALVAGLVAPRHRRAMAEWLALSVGYLPLLLLAGAALRPAAVIEGLIVGIGAAALAAITRAWVRGWWAAALVCAVSVGAYAIDAITGSELTKLSLLGPNPLFGVRFYGIGNELEALIAVMVPVGVGAGLTAAGKGGRLHTRAAVAAFLVAGLIAAVVFGAGRIGADVGAAIVLPLGAAVAATVLHLGSIRPTRQQGLVLTLVIAAPLAALSLLALIDLVSGGNAHLTRSVLDAGGAGDLADVAQRRLQLSGHDFAQAAGNPLFWLVIAGLGVCLAKRRRIDAWLRPVPSARAGLIGACAAVVVGMLVNDSGGTYLALGSIALGAFLAFAWAQRPGPDP